MNYYEFKSIRCTLRYVDGDYNDPATFQQIRKELGSAKILPIAWQFHRFFLEQWFHSLKNQAVRNLI